MFGVSLCCFYVYYIPIDGYLRKCILYAMIVISRLRFVHKDNLKMLPGKCYQIFLERGGIKAGMLKTAVVEHFA